MTLPVLVDVVRSGVLESVHRGSIVVLEPEGELTLGVVDAPVFPRSSLKPLQAVAMLELGFVGRDASLALGAASHDGEDVHIAGARATLAEAGLDESALRCPPDLPSGRAALLAWTHAGQAEAPICHNCSGKHAAMLSTCVANGWSLDYVDPQHPLQQALRARVGEQCGEAVHDVAVDGCGAPAFSVSLRGLARSFAALSTAARGPQRLVAEAMRAHPRLIGGTGRPVTELTTAVPGLVAKEGAEGVWAAALPDGRAMAAKLADGAMRALPPLLAATLLRWGYDVPAVRYWLAAPLLGGGVPVGAITASADLRGLLVP